MGEFQQLGDNESQPKRGGQEVGRGLEQGDTDFLHRADRELDTMAETILLFFGLGEKALFSKSNGGRRKNGQLAQRSGRSMRQERVARQDAAYWDLRKEKPRKVLKLEPPPSTQKPASLDNVRVHNSAFSAVALNAREIVSRVIKLNSEAFASVQRQQDQELEAKAKINAAETSEQRGNDNAFTRPSTAAKEEGAATKASTESLILPSPQPLPPPQPGLLQQAATKPRPVKIPVAQLTSQSVDAASMDSGESGILERRKRRAKAMEEARRKRLVDNEKRDQERQRWNQKQDELPQLAQTKVSGSSQNTITKAAASSDATLFEASSGNHERLPDEQEQHPSATDDKEKTKVVAEWIDPFRPYKHV